MKIGNWTLEMYIKKDYPYYEEHYRMEGKRANIELTKTENGNYIIKGSFENIGTGNLQKILLIENNYSEIQKRLVESMNLIESLIEMQ